MVRLYLDLKGTTGMESSLLPTLCLTRCQPMDGLQLTASATKGPCLARVALMDEALSARTMGAPPSSMALVAHSLQQLFQILQEVSEVNKLPKLQELD